MKDFIAADQPSFRDLMYFITAGGPEESEYRDMTNTWNELVVQQQPTGHAHRLVDLFGPDFLDQTVQGHSVRRPHGYSGDYQIIDFIYQQTIIGGVRFGKWDKYLHTTPATHAVRNRKHYFIELVKSRLANSSGPLRILNIASGPCRDVFELFQQTSPSYVRMHCVDLDASAIQYGKRLLGQCSSTVEFTCANIFKFNTNEKYDLVWSAGLFDYFNDADFVKLLSKIYSWSSTSGEVVVGNFSTDNPTRAYMEKGNDWFLFHRTQAQLISLGNKVKSENDEVELNEESLGINLFLHLKRNTPQ